MTEPQTITADHLRSLLDAGTGARLVLIEGRVDVVGAAQLDNDEYRGALEVTDRDSLAQRLGDDPSDEQLADEAGALTTAAQSLGG
jgi:NADH dehydrogenase